MENVHGVTVTFHPVALFAIVNSHKRRTSTEASDRDAIGSEGEECVRGAQFLLHACVLHNETDLEVAIDMHIVYEQEMFGLHRRAAPNEVMLGW